MVVEIALSSCTNSGVDVCSDRNLSGLKYMDDVVPLIGYLSKLQGFFGRLNDSVGVLVCVLQL